VLQNRQSRLTNALNALPSRTQRSVAEEYFPLSKTASQFREAM
jgi:hypothetical protein